MEYFGYSSLLYVLYVFVWSLEYLGTLNVH